MKRNLITLLLIFVLSLLVSCGDGKNTTKDSNGANANEVSDNFMKEGFPIVKDPITIKFFTGKAVTTAADYNEVTIWKDYTDMTNINIDWGPVLRDAVEEKRNLALASGNLPDVFYSAGLGNNDLIKYGDQGVFIPLNNKIEEYMPNLTKLLDENPEIRKGITFPDGNIYGLPTIYDPDFSSLLIGGKPWINKEWLDQLGMDLPETTDEFYEFLKAVKETDLMGDGKGEEIPFGGDSLSGLRYILSGAFGINVNGVQHLYVDINLETDELRFVPTSDGYKEMLEFMNMLYSEGLILENIFNIETENYYALGSEGRFGGVYITSPETIFGDEAGEKYVGMPALEGPHGDKKYIGIRSSLVQMGAFSITEQNKYVPETLRWMDYFYSDEGTKMFFMGKKDVTYEETADGEVEYLEEITNSDDDMTMEQNLKPHITWLGGGYPGIVMEGLFKGAESLPKGVEAAERLEPHLTEDVLPGFTYTSDESKRKAVLSSDIEKYADEMLDKFVNGERSFDEWDDYVKTFDDMGLEEYLEIEKNAYERYKSN